MRSPRIVAPVVAVAIAVAAAGGGAAVNLTLLEPHRASGAAAVVDIPALTVSTAPPGDGGSPSSAPTSTSAGPGGSTTSSTTTPATIPTTAPTMTQGPRSFTVGEAGTVLLSVRDGRLVIESVDAAPGWTYETGASSGDEVELDFRHGDDREAALHARLQDGQLRVDIETSEGEGPDD